MVHLDNEAASRALVRATTCTVPDCAILQSFIEEEIACQVKVGFQESRRVQAFPMLPAGWTLEKWTP